MKLLLKKKKKNYCFCFFICNESGRKGVVIVFELKLLNLLHPDILRKSPGFIIFKCCSLKPCPQLLSMWVHFRYILVYLWEKHLVFWGLLGWSASPFPYLFYFSFSLRRNKTIWEMINALWFSDNNKTSHGNEKLWRIYPASLYLWEQDIAASWELEPFSCLGTLYHSDVVSFVKSYVLKTKNSF